jgi:hypothetical protein
LYKLKNNLNKLISAFVRLTINPKLMQSAETITDVLKNKSCPTHDVYPHVEIIGNEIKIACCCLDFQGICTEEARQMLADMDIADFVV